MNAYFCNDFEEMWIAHALSDGNSNPNDQICEITEKKFDINEDVNIDLFWKLRA